MNQHDLEQTAQPDAHFHPAFDNLPDWLLKTTPKTRTALKSTRLQRPNWHATATREQQQSLKLANEEHWTQRNRLDTRLARLQSVRDFAESLLNNALKTYFGLELDVKTTFLRLYISQDIPWFPIKSGGARTWTVSLLDAALHNFQASETEKDAYERDSTYITEPSPGGQFDTLPALKRRLPIHGFTRLCRELDIGGQYETYLKDHLGFTSPVTAALLELNVVGTHKAALRAALHLARIRNELPTDAYDSILGLVEGREGMQLDGHPLHGHDLSMMSSSLTGIVVFAPRLDRLQQPTRIIVYIPDDPEHPLKQYPDSLAFMKALTQNLRSPAYQAFFSRFVDHQERGHFFADLSRRLGTVTWHEHKHGDPMPSWRETPIDNPDLRFSVSPIKIALWTHLYQKQLNKILNDARTLAVSTASADRTARWARWDAFSKVATSVLEVAAFVALPFVPFLGELMLSYMAYQLLDEVFEGIVDWAEGLQAEALAQVISLAESVVQLGTFAVGGALAAGAFSRLMSPEAVALFSSLTPVETGGKTRYWKADLGPYEQTVALPTAARPDALGLYPHEGKRLLRLEGKLYAVKPDSKTGRFHIEHPDRTHAYEPPLRHNQRGAWQTVLDQPLTWDRQTVMRRLGPSVESLSSAEREQILRISGFHDNVLREIHVENQRPPSLLTDTIKRFKIDRDIQALINSGNDHPDLYQALNQRLSLFESRYRELEATDDRDVQLLQGAVKYLPTDVAQELVSNASGSELMQMHAGQVPPRLRDVAVKATEAVRVARAYEGFYLEDKASTDYYRLALHSLESMPGWPADLRIEIREDSPTGALTDSIGMADASTVRTLVQTADGTFQVPEMSDSPVTFYQALLETLTDAQRNTLGLVARDGETLKQRIAEHATQKPELRTLFANHPHRKPFYDPTTMRLPGGADGYPRINRETPTFDDRVREVYPSLTQEELSVVVSRLQQHPDGARSELTRLARELDRLHQDLNRWINDSPTTDPETQIPLSAESGRAVRHNRRLLAQEIQRSWRRQSDRDFNAPEGSEGYSLQFAETLPGDLPTLTADFSHVSSLQLQGSYSENGVPGFLQGFTGLRQLELRRFRLNTLPDAIGRMADLEVLILNNCAINFDAAAWSKLASMRKIQSLDLFANPFKDLPNIESMPSLAHLDLSQTGLTHIPSGALQHTKLNTLLLMNNHISELPAGLFESPVYEKRGIHLSNNPLSDRARERVKQHYFENAYDLGVAAPEADIQRVTALYPGMEFEQASDFVYELPGTLADGSAELAKLEMELSRMSDDLAAWTADLPPLHPLTGEPFNMHQLSVEHANRDQFAQAVERCWRRESELDDFSEALEPTFELVINTPINGALPTLSADFSHVTSLELQGVNGVTRLGQFLQSFPNLASLSVRNCHVGDLPDAVFKMGQLRSLTLPNCQITLTLESANALAGMERLEYLDLGLNPLGQTLDLRQMPDLSTLRLNGTGMTEIPHGLFQLTDLDWADLSANAITDVPSDLMELPVNIAESISLRGNPFSGESLARLIRYYESTRVDFGVEEVINRGEMEVSTSEGSEIDE